MIERETGLKNAPNPAHPNPPTSPINPSKADSLGRFAATRASALPAPSKINAAIKILPTTITPFLCMELPLKNCLDLGSSI